MGRSVKALVDSGCMVTVVCSELVGKCEGSTEMIAFDGSRVTCGGKQRLKIVLEAIHKELETYKNRCLGVDTIVLALKESKKENDKLCKHIKATDQQMSVLQKRLAKHGLPDSVNVQDSELFVPGASKQTLDNLAKENARLRSLLKQEGGHAGKKSTDEFEDMKAALEEATCEIDELRSKLRSQEEMKLEMVRDYECEIRKLAEIACD